VCYFGNVFGQFSESVSKILQEIGRGFLLFNWTRGSFPCKNTVSDLLFSATILFLVHCKHSVRTVLKSVFRNSKNRQTQFTPLLCSYTLKSNSDHVGPSEKNILQRFAKIITKCKGKFSLPQSYCLQVTPRESILHLIPLIRRIVIDNFCRWFVFQ